MEIKHIKAIGSLIAEYHSDLTFISKFQKYKNEQRNYKTYLNEAHGFQKFVNAFRIARNFEKGKAGILLELTIKYIEGTKNPDVMNFVKFLQNNTSITRGKNTVSLASKILFLNSPIEIVPFDRQVMKSLGMRENDYSIFIKKKEVFIKQNNEVIQNCIKEANLLLNKIEKGFEKDKFGDMNIIRENRFIDKLLWVSGK